MRKTGVLILSCLCSLFICAQTTNSVQSKLVQFAHNAALFGVNYAQEKVYLHFDNTGYFLGETIWFKAYVVNALDNSPSSMSKTLYVELRTQEGDLISGKKLKISNGICSGDFMLQDSLPGGFYEVRAFTRSMLNFGEEVIFSRVFPVYSAPKNAGDFTERILIPRKNRILETRKPADTEKINIAFFPEGGNLIVGMKCNIAFKATDKMGRSIAVSGTVVDEKKKVVAILKSDHEGMGVFSLIPTKERLEAHVVFNKLENIFNLPEANFSGYVMTVDGQKNPNSDSIHVQITQSPALLAVDSMALVVTCKGKLMDFLFVKTVNNQFQHTFSKKNLSHGVNQLTLYDVNGKIQSERLVFISPFVKTNKKSPSAVLNYSIQDKILKPYQAIKLELSCPDSIETAKGTSVSVSIRDAESSNFGNSDNSNMLTNLLLSSDLKGYIQSPAWYFEENSADRAQGLDLLMLTQGWRRYKWERMEGVEPFNAIHPIEEKLVIDGKVVSLLFKNNRTDIDITLWMTRGMYSYNGKTKTDSLGRFSFFVDDIYDTWDLNVVTQKEDKNKEYRILLNRQFSPAPKTFTGYDYDIVTNHANTKVLTLGDSLVQLFNRKEVKVDNRDGETGIMLKEFVKTAEARVSFMQDIERRASVNMNIAKKLDDIRDVAHREYSYLKEYLIATHPYFNINDNILRYKSRKVEIIVRKEGSELYDDPRPEGTLLEDIVKVLIIEDHDEILKYDPNNWEDPVVIYVIVKKESYRIPLGLRRTTFDGYVLSRTFYEPIYQSGQPVVDPDYRRTLYWNPDLILDKSGKVNIEFFNNKSCTKLVVDAEGITSKGVLLMHSKDHK